MNPIQELLDTPLELLLAAARTPAEQVDALVRRANAEMDHADVDRGKEIALDAVKLARTSCPKAARERVLALLCFLRTAPDNAAPLLAEAHEVAEQADEPQLITAIVHAARTLGVPLPTHVF
ncbi:MAG: hypothetical protein VX519_12615 [Myxococcota bacterium]|nr:hypothetical protein [Myxococcota bacterium]